MLDAGTTGLTFEVDQESEILDRADLILSDVIDINGWSQRGWIIIVDIYPDISDILGSDAPIQ